VRFPFNLPKEKAFDCVGFGLNAVDHLVVVPRYPSFDTKTMFLEHRQSAGGQTASAMVGLRRLGLGTAYAGRFGSDPEGYFGLGTLREEDVDVECAEVVDGALTQVAYIIIDARYGERTIIWNRDDRLAYSADEAPIQFAGQGRVLHLDAHDPPACARMAQTARASGAIVSADIDNVYPGVEALLPHIDLLISSKEFPYRLTGVREERPGLLEIKSRYGCAITGMTLGARGALLYHEGVFIESPALPVPGGCRDTTGAGDAFHAGFLYGLLRGREIEESLRLANATAALKCRGLGARTSLPSEMELLEFVQAEG
jgi:sulfofructose kinase